ncbi:hypothetical protein H1R20_g8560, partial [Candolleomyces eurysporus]
MPFHISYSGPAAISTFMDVKPAKEDQNSAQVQTPASNSTEESKSEAMSADQPEAVGAVAMSVDDATGDKTQFSGGA